MLLKQKSTGKLVEITDIEELTDPDITHLTGCLQWSEDFSDHKSFSKQSLLFPSGEELPKCWYDANFRIDDVLESNSILSYINAETDGLFRE